MSAQRILIVGAGRVGSALAANLLRHGYEVEVAVRDPRAAAVPPGVTAVPLADAAATHDLAILAVPFSAVTEALLPLGLRRGTVLVDATNPFGRPLPEGLPSGAAVVAHAAGEGVRVVKAFNVLGAEHMASPALADGCLPLLPVAGDDPAAVARIVDLAADLDFDSVAVGGLGAAAVLEEAARYWGLVAAARENGRDVVLVAHRRGVA